MRNIGTGFRLSLAPGVLAAVAALVALAALAAPALAQALPADFRAASRYDAERRVTGAIVPDPQGAGTLGLAAVPGSDDPVGNLGKFEAGDLSGGQPESGSPPAGDSVTHIYDKAGRLVSATTTMGGVSRTVGYVWDSNSNLRRLTYPDGFFVEYEYDGLDRMTAIRERDPATGLPGAVVASFAYDELGRRKTLTRANGTVTRYAYDPASRLARLEQDLPGTANDLTLTFEHNPAGQIVETTRSNTLYSWIGSTPGTIATTANGQNQPASWNGALEHDAKGNITAIGGSAYAYSSENLLTSAAGTALTYDPLMRLHRVGGSTDVRRLYDGDKLIAEYGPAGNMGRRFVHGPGVDEPLIWYGLGGASRRFLHADERGSIIAATDDHGAPVHTYRYDEYGAWDGGNAVRFGYTGQTGYPSLGLFYYKARWYHPGLGRFMQPDPIGYDDQVNLYAYVGSDPINRRDPTGLDGGCIYAPSGCNYDTSNLENFLGGVVSYPRDVAAAYRYLLDSSGLSGEAAQNRARLVTQLSGRAFDYIRNHPGDVARQAVGVIQNNKAFLAGRVIAGAAVSGGAGPLFGGSMSASSLQGGGINAINRVVSQLEAGNVSTGALSDRSLGTIAAFGILGGSAQFNSKTGDIVATIRTNDNSSGIPQTRRVVICNVNSEKGC